MLRRPLKLQKSFGRRLRVERLEDRRMLAAGNLDLTFHFDGIVTASIGSETHARDIQIQSDGKIVIAGNTYSQNLTSALLARYNPNGTLDTSFGGGDGIVNPLSANTINAMAIQADGKFIVTGRTQTNEAGPALDTSLVTYRYNSDGSIDNSFGVRKLDVSGGTDEANDVAIQADGKVVVAGYGNDDFVLIRYNTNGTLDTSFDGDGWLRTGFAGSDRINAVVVQADGKIVAAGETRSASNTDVALARYNTDGSLDTSFDGDGKVTTAIGSATDTAFGIALQPDGKIVVGGRSDDGTLADFAAARYNADGSLDSTFSGDGKLTTPFGSAHDIAHAVAIQSDGKIVLVGYSQNPTNYDFALSRYNPDGTPDTSFSGDGKLITTIASANDYGFAAALQPDGLLVVAGFSGATNNTIGVLARYETGTPPVNPGDYNRNGIVDTADYILWRKTQGVINLPAYIGADGNGDGAIGPEDYGVWRLNYGHTVLGAAAGNVSIQETNATTATNTFTIQVQAVDHKVSQKVPQAKNRAATQSQIYSTEVRDNALLSCLTTKPNLRAQSGKSEHDAEKPPVDETEVSDAALDGAILDADGFCPKKDLL